MEDGPHQELLLPAAADGRGAVTQLIPAVAELRVVASLDEDPACPRGEKPPVGFDLLTRGQAVTGRVDLGHVQVEARRVGLPARMRRADQDQAVETVGMLPGKPRRQLTAP